MSREAKYRLAFTAPGAGRPETPSRGDLRTLAGALAAGWANDDSGGRSFGITFGGLPVMREEELSQAFALLSVLLLCVVIMAVDSYRARNRAWPRRMASARPRPALFGERFCAPCAF